MLYLAVVLDVWSRRIVGWAMATHLRTELLLDALGMAIQQRQPAEFCCLHSHEVFCLIWAHPASSDLIKVIGLSAIRA